MGMYYFASLRANNDLCAKALVSKYHGQTFLFNAWRSISTQPARMTASVMQECHVLPGEEKAVSVWWADIMCMEITNNGISGELEASRANQFCNVLYGMLRNDGELFQYGRMGVEVCQFADDAEIRHEIAEGNFEGFEGLMVRKGFVDGFPNKVMSQWFESFSDTHVWIPKKAEQRR